MATLEELDEAALIQILVEPKNALSKQYQKMFRMEGVELEIRDGALRAIAGKALARKTGARGLRSILEQVLLDVMYDLPSHNNLARVDRRRSHDHQRRQAAADVRRPAEGRVGAQLIRRRRRRTARGRGLRERPARRCGGSARRRRRVPSANPMATQCFSAIDRRST